LSSVQCSWVENLFGGQLDTPSTPHPEKKGGVGLLAYGRRRWERNDDDALLLLRNGRVVMRRMDG